MKRSPWLTCISPAPSASIRLLCFPYAASGAKVFQFLARVLPRQIRAQVDIWAIEYPGHGARYQEAPARRFSNLVQGLAPAVIPFFDRSVLFFGYSLGALLCFETARLLQQATGRGPCHLLIAACRAPHLCAVEECSDAETLVAYLRALGMNPNEQEIAQRWPWYQAVFGLRNTYRYTPAQPLDCPMSVFGGEDDPECDETSLWAWQEHTICSPIQCFLIPGQHLFLHHPTFLRHLSEHLQSNSKRGEAEK
ncbi:MAG: thioesterase [Chloroflexi bacterium]|nr:thioesterase [Chloroflexota bacterium]